MTSTTTKKNKGRGDINTNSKLSDRNPIHVYNPIITPRATHMSHARVPVILDEDIRRNYLNQHNKKHVNIKRRISSGSNSGNGSGSGSGSMSNSSSSYENHNTDGGRDLLERQSTRRIVSPDLSKRPQQWIPLSAQSSNQLRVDTKRPTQTTIMRRHQGKILDQDTAMTTDPHLKEHHLWDEFGFQKCSSSSSYSCSLDDCSTVGTSTSRRHLLKPNQFLNSSFTMMEEEEYCNSRDASNHRGNAFSISKLIQIKSRNKKKKENGRKDIVSTGGGATTAATVSMQDCDVVSVSKWVEVDDDCFDFQRRDKFGQDGHMDPPIFLNNVKNEIHNVAAALGAGGGGGDESDFKSLPETEISMDPINADIPQYTFDVQTYGEKVQKYDTMRMVGKYRLAYESMILDEMTGDLDRYYTTTTTTPCELSGIGVGNGVGDGDGAGADELLSDSLMSRKSRKGMGRSSGAVDRSIATPTIETLGDTTHSLDQKARVLDKFNSHDEMSPLVMRNKTHIESRHHHEHIIHDHLQDTPTRKNTNCMSTEKGATKVVQSPSRPITIDKGPRQMKNISHDEIMSPRVQNKITKNHDAIITDESMVESANEKANVSLEASEVHILHSDKEQVHSTPKKAKNTKKSGGGGPFLDNSWQPSPIQPEGSFAIFNDSQVVPLHKYETLAIISKAVQTSPVPIETDEKPYSRLEFLKIVAAIVIQTFFRRHLAYKLACKRYSAVLKIQRFLGSILERKKFQQAVMKHTAFQFYDLAAIQIQAAWRGW
eukprot:CAMPEP_0176505814 /NCGR_PEP_ID=MMETSP0200_2-20121128/16703_1 /TAXON_ID=947934 /ORGANISM="Chaetoceros sp., Strain GSL56" /LENGTH=767 /DNA_ID=CAMNT_0017905409 /DNA_START=187 /DNA_END=2487 /DNA_ORIENTATION=+